MEFLSTKAIGGVTKKKKTDIFGCIKIQTISTKKIIENKNKRQNQPEKNVCNKNIKKFMFLKYKIAFIHNKKPLNPKEKCAKNKNRLFAEEIQVMV